MSKIGSVVYEITEAVENGEGMASVAKRLGCGLPFVVQVCNQAGLLNCPEEIIKALGAK